jgi:hypothetical protein
MPESWNRAFGTGGVLTNQFEPDGVVVKGCFQYADRGGILGAGALASRVTS